MPLKWEGVITEKWCEAVRVYDAEGRKGRDRVKFKRVRRRFFQFPQKLVKTCAYSDALKLRVESELDKLKIGLLIAVSDPH